MESENNDECKYTSTPLRKSRAGAKRFITNDDNSSPIYSSNQPKKKNMSYINNEDLNNYFEDDFKFDNEPATISTLYKNGNVTKSLFKVNNGVSGNTVKHHDLLLNDSFIKLLDVDSFPSNDDSKNDSTTNKGDNFICNKSGNIFNNKADNVDTNTCNVISNEKYCRDSLSMTPDIFEVENNEINILTVPEDEFNDDEHAWDMSISVKIRHENCDKSKCSNSQNNSQCFNDEKNNCVETINELGDDNEKWENDSLLCNLNTPERSCTSRTLVDVNKSDSKKLIFGDKVKQLLLNNAKLSSSGNIIFNNENKSGSQGLVKNRQNPSSSFFGLPLHVKSLIKKYKGITSLYDWQEECLNLQAIRDRKNLVYALPTSGGKTLVAEILILNEILCRGKDVILVMPYVSIVQEKVRSLSPFAVELGFLVEEYAGAKGQFPPKKRKRKRTVFIATIEKSLGLIHSYFETNRLSELGLVVVDELHLIGESRRGASLEAMLAKLLFSSVNSVQVIGMSATIGNINEIAQFLKADVYTHDFRPVELKEYIKVEDEIFYVKPLEDPPLVFHSKKKFPYSEELKKLDPDEIGGLVREVAPNDSCLVFCPSKKNCENVALLICQVLARDLLNNKTEEKNALLKALASEGNGTICKILQKTLPYGVAYHNSSLTTAERKLLEEAFSAKTIFCICCTSTLAAGVNLPAKRVILRSPYIGREFINISRYKQMVGRAGRAGISGGKGESFLICSPTDTLKVGAMLHSPMDCCKSHLIEHESINSFFISTIGLSITPTVTSIRKLLKSTLYKIQNPKNFDIDELIDNVIGELVNYNVVRKVKKNQNDEDTLELSTLGKAAMKGGHDMTTANTLFNDLQVAKKSLVVVNHLHLLYLITPYVMMEQIPLNSKNFISKYMKLTSKELNVATVLGIDERCISFMMSGHKIKDNLLYKVHRFYLSLMLFDLWNESNVWTVSESYQVSRGLVHMLLNSSVSFAASASRFCEELEEMWCFRRLFVEITSRLSHCCKPELIPLMELPAVRIGRARQLYDAGFKTINVIANAEPNSLVKAIDHLPRRVAHQIVAAAKLQLMTTVETLQEEAEEVLAVLQNKLDT